MWFYDCERYWPHSKARSIRKKSLKNRAKISTVWRPDDKSLLVLKLCRSVNPVSTAEPSPPTSSDLGNFTAWPKALEVPQETQFSSNFDQFPWAGQQLVISRVKLTRIGRRLVAVWILSHKIFSFATVRSLLLSLLSNNTSNSLSDRQTLPVLWFYLNFSGHTVRKIQTLYFNKRQGPIVIKLASTRYKVSIKSKVNPK